MKFLVFMANMVVWIYSLIIVAVVVWLAYIGLWIIVIPVIIVFCGTIFNYDVLAKLLGGKKKDE